MFQYNILIMAILLAIFISLISNPNFIVTVFLVIGILYAMSTFGYFR